MTDSEILLRCLELAIDRANRERAGEIPQEETYLDRVAFLQDWFYTHVVKSAEMPKQARRPSQKTPIQAAAR